jgi:hypothetical protein
MSLHALTPDMLRKRGLKALEKALGPIGMVRFLQQFESGAGDYTKERLEWLGDRDVEAMVTQIKERRKTK